MLPWMLHFLAICPPLLVYYVKEWYPQILRIVNLPVVQIKKIHSAVIHAYEMRIPSLEFTMFSNF